MSSSPVSPTGKKLKTMTDEPGFAFRRINDQADKNNSNSICNQKGTTNDPSDKGINSLIDSKKAETINIANEDNLRIPKASASGDPQRRQDSSNQSGDKVELTLEKPRRNDSVKSQSKTDRSSPLDGSQPEHIDEEDDDDDDDDEMHDADGDLESPRIVVIGDDFPDSETTVHSGDQDDYMEVYSNEDSEENLVFLNHITDSDSEDSSGYMGYENAVAGRYYYDHDDDSLDMESDEEENDGINHYSPDEYLQYDPTPDHPYPKPEWITLNELRARKCGFASSRNLRRRQNMFWFERYASNSLWMVQRLQVVKKLQQHTGCVNSLCFSSSGNLLCSGSDDLDVCIWDWKRDSDQLRAEICTGHNNNVFQSVFCNRDTNIVTSSRDGSVRLIDIETRQNEKLMSSTGEIQKIAFISDNSFLTCGTNASVNMIDLRTRETKKLFTVRSPKTNQTCQLHSINSHPLDKHMIAVAGKSPYVFLYDLRRLPREQHDPEIKPTYNLGNLKNSDVRVTSTAFNSTGDKLLISYNDDDLYVCRTDTSEIIHRYRGHRNKKTYKGCAWFGDNFVLSGSDDGHIYGWDLDSEHIVCFLQGDRGIVNCLLVHPTLPVLASSGLESDVKIWEPVADEWPQTMKGIKPQICKNTMRRKLARSRYFGRRCLVGGRSHVVDVEDTTDEWEVDDDDDDNEDR